MKFRALIIPAIAAVICAISATAQENGNATTLHVASTPPDAIVFIDDEMAGNTPLTLEVATPGTHLLKLTLRGHKDSLRTVDIGGSRQMAMDIAMEPITGLVLVHSIPSNAIVEIDGIERGKTPLLITDLPIGEYRVNVFETGYLAKELQLKVEDRTPVRLDTELTSDSATLRIETDPPGARVTVNGIHHGTTPCTADGIPAGESEIELILQGYSPASRNVTLAAGQEEEISITLLPLPASLKIASVPPEARIYVNNQFKGTAPLNMENLEPGEYRLRAEIPGYEPLARTVTLGLAQGLVEEFRMQRNSGGLQITTQPSGVQLFVDGKESGRTKAKPSQTDQISEPLLADLIPPGDHTIELTKPGYHTQSATVTIERDKTLIQHFQLKRMFIPDYEVKTGNDTIHGVLLQVDAQGDVKIEIRPGIVKTIPAAEIISREPLRKD